MFGGHSQTDESYLVQPFRVFSGMRFSAEQHLRRPGDIRAVREKGQRAECRAFTVWWKRREPAAALPAPSEAAKVTTPAAPLLSQARVCVIASTAAVGDAVRRNRAKRRLREVFRHQQATVPPDCDLLLIARRAAIDCPMEEMQSRFTEACRRMTPAPKP